MTRIVSILVLQTWFQIINGCIAPLRAMGVAWLVLGSGGGGGGGLVGPPCLRQHAGGWRHPRSLPDLQSHGALLPVGLCAHSKQELLRIASYTRIETKVAWK